MILMLRANQMFLKSFFMIMQVTFLAPGLAFFGVKCDQIPLTFTG